MLYRSDPGPCPICGAAHTTCGGDERGRTSIVQLPQRDAAAVAEADVAAPPIVAELPTPPRVVESSRETAIDVATTVSSGSLTAVDTGTYRGTRPPKRK